MHPSHLYSHLSLPLASRPTWKPVRPVQAPLCVLGHASASRLLMSLSQKRLRRISGPLVDTQGVYNIPCPRASRRNGRSSSQSFISYLSCAFESIMLSNVITSGLGAALLASVAHANPLPSLESRQTGCGTHGPTNRACWNGDYQISSDYETLVPPNGKLRTVSIRPPSVSHDSC